MMSIYRTLRNTTIAPHPLNVTFGPEEIELLFDGLRMLESVYKIACKDDIDFEPEQDGETLVKAREVMQRLGM